MLQCRVVLKILLVVRTWVINVFCDDYGQNDKLLYRIMERFEFSSSEKEVTVKFSGQIFYDIYKDSEFLKHDSNVETILSKSYELSNKMKTINPGVRVSIGMMLERNIPLLVMKAGSDIDVENFEFTHNRLNGLVAAYAFDNRHRFPKLSSTEARVLGLTWDNQDEKKCRLFLSAVRGTQLFYNHFKFWPLVCALRKYQMNKTTKEVIMEIANLRNEHGVTMAEDMMNNFDIVTDLWSSFSGSSCDDLLKQLDRFPPEIKMLFRNNT